MRTEPVVLAFVLASCFDGRGLEGAPCHSDGDCGPKLGCIGAGAGLGVCGGGEGGDSRWPDSPLLHCTDGSQDVTCPEPGQPGFGQDGNYRIAVPSYDESEGVVVDSITGLAWEAQSTVDGHTQADAFQRCEDLSLGQRDWRLPSRMELLSIVDMSGLATPWNGVYDDGHWSSSPRGSDFWVVDFTALEYPDSPELEYRVLCVSGAGLESSLTIANSTVVDTMSGLEWQSGRGPDVAWLAALEYCEALQFDSHDDWRLPSAKELVTLTLDDQDSALGPDGDGAFWSSTPGADAIAGTVIFPDGAIGGDDTLLARQVRCVRGPV